MKHPDYDRAFHETPDYIRSAIELGMKKGEKKMRSRQKFMRTLAVAATFAVILGAAAFGASRLAAPRPDNRAPSRPLSAPIAAGMNRQGAGTESDPFLAPTGILIATIAPVPTSEPAFPEIVYYTEGGLYFHSERDCSGLENGIEGSVQDAYHAGKEPCPICLAGWSFEVNAVPEATPAPTALVSAEPTSAPTVGAEVEYISESVASGETEWAEAPGVEAEEAAFPYAYLGLSPEDAAYCAPGDARFHFNATCPLLEGQVTVVTSLGAAMEDHVACEKCKLMNSSIVLSLSDGTLASAATGETLVYYTPNGKYFHVRYDCSGMTGAELHTAHEAACSNKHHCPVCIGKDAKKYWLPLPAEDGDEVLISPYSGYYHRSGECFNLPSKSVTTYGAVQSEGQLAPCPYCLPELAGEFNSPRCCVADGDQFYHSYSKCPNLSGGTLTETSELAAQAEGRIRCQVCADATAPLPDFGEQFVRLFGSWLDEAYPGWIFERADIRADGGADWFVSTDGSVSIDGVVSPNPRRACRVTAEPDGAVSFELGGSDTSGCDISHDFLNRLPTAILTACKRDAAGAILRAMDQPDEAAANEIFDNVDAIHIAAGADGEIASFEIEFRAPDDDAAFDGSATITLRWRSANGGYELYDLDSDAASGESQR